MRISVWSADVCSCDLPENQLSYAFPLLRSAEKVRNDWKNFFVDRRPAIAATADDEILRYVRRDNYRDARGRIELTQRLQRVPTRWDVTGNGKWRSEEHTSELQSLMRISYAVFCFNKKNTTQVL